MSKYKNIIFDLHGVLFEYAPGPDFSATLLHEGVALLHECSQAADMGLRLFACTNTAVDYIEILKQTYPHIMGCFEGIVTPTEAHARKPDPALFHYMMNTYQLHPHETLFIDDQLFNVEAALRFGIAGIHANDFEHVRRELEKYTILKGAGSEEPAIR